MKRGRQTHIFFFFFASLFSPLLQGHKHTQTHNTIKSTSERKGEKMERDLAQLSAVCLFVRIVHGFIF